jgi:hypothetical protein
VLSALLRFFINKMESVKEQRVRVKCCFKLGTTASETHKMFQQAFGNEAMCRTQCFEWFSRFKAGQTSFEDDERSGCPSTSKTEANTEKGREAVHGDRRQSIQDIASAVGISYVSKYFE